MKDSAWKDRMIAKYGSEEAVMEEMAKRQKKSRENYSGNGGFRSMDKDRLKEISKKGLTSRWKKEGLI